MQYQISMSYSQQVCVQPYGYFTVGVQLPLTFPLLYQLPNYPPDKAEWKQPFACPTGCEQQAELLVLHVFACEGEKRGGPLIFLGK